MFWMPSNNKPYPVPTQIDPSRELFTVQLLTFCEEKEILSFRNQMNQMQRNYTPVGQDGPEHHGVAHHRGDHDHGEGHRPRLLPIAPQPGRGSRKRSIVEALN